jgi:hypothetical protein
MRADLITIVGESKGPRLDQSHRCWEEADPRETAV